MKFHGKL